MATRRSSSSTTPTRCTRAKGAAAVKFLNTGQACICPNRFYVHRVIADAFVSTMRDRVCGPAGRVGPDRRRDRRPADRRRGLGQDGAPGRSHALDKGATLELGGERLTRPMGSTPGFFYAPTLLTGVTPDMEIYRQETFGPLAPIIVYDDEDEAIEMANDTEYGLASYLYTRDLSRAFPRHGATALRHRRRQRHQPHRRGRSLRWGEGERARPRGGQQGIAEYLDTKLVGLSI